MGFPNNSTFGFSGNNGGGGGGGGLTAANNGLTVVTGDTVQLGGPLLHDTVVDGTSAFQMTFTSGLNGNVATLNGVNTGTASGILGTAISGNGVGGASVSGVGVSGRSTSGTGGNFHSGSSVAGVFNITPNVLNTNAAVLQIQRDATGGTAANGISGSIDFITKTTTQLEFSNQIKSGWADATDATRLSKFVITGAQNTALNDLFSLLGTGAAQLNQYGSGTFTGTPTFFLAVNASGNIIETASGGGGIASANNGLSIFGGNTVQLGNAHGDSAATLLNDREIPLDNNKLYFTNGVDTGSNPIQTIFDGATIQLMSNASGNETPEIDLEEYSSGVAGSLYVSTAGIVILQTNVSGSGLQIFSSGNVSVGTSGSDNSIGQVQVSGNMTISSVNAALPSDDVYGMAWNFSTKEVVATFVPPFFGANNGLSIDTTSGNVVLGNDIFDGIGASALLNDREIPFGTNEMFFSNGQDTLGNDIGMFIAASGVNIDSNNNEFAQPQFLLQEYFSGAVCDWHIGSDGIIKFESFSFAGLWIYPSARVAIGNVNSISDNGVGQVQVSGNLSISTVNTAATDNPVKTLFWDSVTDEVLGIFGYPIFNAANGLSLDDDNNAVLGNNQGDTAAVFTSNRELPLAGNELFLTNGVDSSSHPIRTIMDGTVITVFSNAAEVNLPGYYIEEYSTGTNATFLINTAGSVFMGMDVPTASGITIYATGTIRVGDDTGDNGASFQIQGNSSLGVVTSSAASLTLSNAGGMYVFTGSSATAWTLPTASGKTGWYYLIKNRGSAAITLSGNVNIYTTSSVSSLVINPGDAHIIYFDGTLWASM